MATRDKNDLLASNLLFATLGLTLLYEVAGWISQALFLPHNCFSLVHFNLLTTGALSLSLLVRGDLVRRIEADQVRRDFYNKKYRPNG